MIEKKISPAEIAAKEALESVFACIHHRQSFVLEAGAGAGKTYSLVHALRFLIKEHGKAMLRNKQQIACITYTNVASNEIASRTDSHPAIFSSTIHAFSWAIIKDYQSALRKILPSIGSWQERLTEAEVVEVGSRKISYDLGYPKITESEIWLSHNDILRILVEFLKEKKFRFIVTDKFPVIFIDEYQDTDANVVEAIKTHFLGTNEGPLLGFFGDHWQKIYGNGCGKIEHANLKMIGKKANFRSAKKIVDSLNRMRPELPQNVSDEENLGEVTVYHTNGWTGSRLTGAHWAGDLPAAESHRYLEELKARLASEGWDFTSSKSKILMLTHKGLASEQGYKGIADLFSNTDQFIKKEDPYIAFFLDTLEPVSQAYANKRFGQMFSVMDQRTVHVNSHDDKLKWAEDMKKLDVLRSNASIGEVLDHLKECMRPRLSDKIEINEHAIAKATDDAGEELKKKVEHNEKFRSVSYSEIIALSKYVNDYSPFSTKHGVKGAEFENVLVVVGRGWSKYNFNKMLERAGTAIAADQQANFEENRNLFYVACSRPKQRLAILFTQELSAGALAKLGNWFGQASIKSIV